MSFLSQPYSAEVYNEHRWLWEGKFNFLSGTPIPGNRVAFNSFRRAGNSFMRKFIQQISGIETGSSLGIHTGTILQVVGFKGEGYQDDSVFVVKT